MTKYFLILSVLCVFVVPQVSFGGTAERLKQLQIEMDNARMSHDGLGYMRAEAEYKKLTAPKNKIEEVKKEQKPGVVVNSSPNQSLTSLKNKTKKSKKAKSTPKPKVYTIVKDLYSCKETKFLKVTLDNGKSIPNNADGFDPDDHRCCPPVGKDGKVFQAPTQCSVRAATDQYDTQTGKKLHSKGDVIKITAEGVKPELDSRLACTVMTSKDGKLKEEKWNVYRCNSDVEETVSKDAGPILDEADVDSEGAVEYRCKNSVENTAYGHKLYPMKDSLLIADPQSEKFLLLKHTKPADAQAEVGKGVVACDLNDILEKDEDAINKLISESMTSTQAYDLGCTNTANPIAVTLENPSRSVAKIDISHAKKGSQASYTFSTLGAGPGYPKSIDVSWNDGDSPQMKIDCEGTIKELSFANPGTPLEGSKVKVPATSGGKAD